MVGQAKEQKSEREERGRYSGWGLGPEWDFRLEDWKTGRVEKTRDPSWIKFQDVLYSR